MGDTEPQLRPEALVIPLPPQFQDTQKEKARINSSVPEPEKTATSGVSFLRGSQGIFLKRLFWFHTFEKNLVFLRHLPWAWGQTAEQRVVLLLVISRALTLSRVCQAPRGLL